MDFSLALGGIDLTLFDSANQASALVSLTTAISVAAGAAPAAVAIRRVRDVTFPLTPVVIFLNPQFAGDSFSLRRLQRQRQLSGSGSVSVDAQILFTDNGAATALRASLAAAPAALAAGVASSLANQGSPLAVARVSVSVQPYTSASVPASSGAPSSVVLAAVSAAAAIVALASGYVLYFRAVRNRNASVEPADDSDIGARIRALPQPPPKQRSEAAALQLRTVTEGQDWRSFNREFLTGADMDFLVALGALDADGKRIGAVETSADVRARFSTVVLDRLVAFGVLGG